MVRLLTVLMLILMINTSRGMGEGIAGCVAIGEAPGLLKAHFREICCHWGPRIDDTSDMKMVVMWKLIHDYIVIRCSGSYQCPKLADQLTNIKTNTNHGCFKSPVSLPRQPATATPYTYVSTGNGHNTSPNGIENIPKTDTFIKSTTDTPSTTMIEIITTSTTDIPTTSTIDTPTALPRYIPTTSAMDIPNISAMDIPNISAMEIPTTSTTLTTGIPKSSTTKLPNTSSTEFPATSRTDAKSTSITEISTTSRSDAKSTSSTEFPATSRTDAKSTSTTEFPIYSTTKIPSSRKIDIPTTPTTPALTRFPKTPKHFILFSDAQPKAFIFGSRDLKAVKSLRMHVGTESCLTFWALTSDSGFIYGMCEGGDSLHIGALHDDAIELKKIVELEGKSLFKFSVDVKHGILIAKDYNKNRLFRCTMVGALVFKKCHHMKKLIRPVLFVTDKRNGRIYYISYGKNSLISVTYDAKDERITKVTAYIDSLFVHYSDDVVMYSCTQKSVFVYIMKPRGRLVRTRMKRLKHKLEDSPLIWRVGQKTIVCDSVRGFLYLNGKAQVKIWSRLVKGYETSYMIVPLLDHEPTT